MTSPSSAVTPLARARDSRFTWPLLTLALLLAADVAKTPDFLHVTVLQGHLFGPVVEILRNSAPTMLVAVGMTLVIATRGIDLSVGAVVAIAGATACQFIVDASSPGGAASAFAGMALAVALCAVLGAWNGFLVTVGRIQPIIATLVLMIAGRGLAMLITDGQQVRFHNDTFKTVGSGYWFVPVSVVIALAVYAVAQLVTRRTALGTLIECVGVNPEASRLVGVRTRSIIFAVYVFSAVCAAVAGLVTASNVSASDANNQGLFLELDAILAVVIGGTSLLGGRFSLTGSVLGALVIATMDRTITNLGIPPEYRFVFKAAVVILVCVLQSPRARSAFRRRERQSGTPAATTHDPSSASTRPVPAGAAQQR